MRAVPEQIDSLVPLLLQLWPDHSDPAAKGILREYICGKEAAAFVYFSGSLPIGLAMCSLRHDYVEGCDSSPVGYLEGIVVDAEHRLQGTARLLCGECEQWAKEQGCSEFASDCELTNTQSLKFHLGIGFSEENRIICFKKSL